MNAHTYQGVPVANGMIRGRAQVVRDWKKEIPVDAGAILISRFPVPKISPMLKHASALLCAYGSSNSYLANAAREQGIPAVFQLGQSLDSVVDGEWLVVDGATGQVISERP
jgi:pyruvate,water dikinase